MRKNPSVTGSLDPSIQSSLRRKTSRAAKPEAGLLSRTQFVCSLFRNTSQPTMSPEFDELLRHPLCDAPLQFPLQKMKDTSAQLQRFTRCQPKHGSRSPQR